MFESLLVGTDGSASSLRAVRRAQEFAARFDAALTVLTVQDDTAAGRAIIEKVRSEVDGEYETKLETGDPSEAIVRAAGDAGIELVVVGNRGMRGMSRFLGSVPNKISHHVPASLLIVDTVDDRPDGPYGKLVVGTDGSSGARTAMATASEVATRYGAELVVLTAYHPLSPHQQASIRAVAPAEISGRLSGTAAAEDVLFHAQRVMEKLGRTARFEYFDGNPASAIVDFATNEGCDLIVTGSKGMTGAARFLGSVPNKVSHHAPCDLLVVHTEQDTKVDLSHITLGASARDT